MAALAAVTLMTLGSFLVVRPFIPAALWAVIFAVSSWPLFTLLEKKLGGRSGAAAGIITILFILVFLVPIAFVGVKLAEQSALASDLVRQLLSNGLPPLPSWATKIPLAGKFLSEKWSAFSATTPTLLENLGPYMKSVGGMLFSAGASIGLTIGMMFLSMFILFFFLKEGRSIATVLDRMAYRIGDEKGRRLLNLAGATMSSVVYGILGAAFVQGLLATFGFWLAGVPGWLFLGIAVGAVALIPVGLTNIILFPVAGWLFYTGQTGWGIFMIVWGLFVGNIDGYIRPAVISRGANLPFIIVFLGVLGGIATGGILGLFIGATVLGVFYTLLTDWASWDNGCGETAPATTNVNND